MTEPSRDQLPQPHEPSPAIKELDRQVGLLKSDSQKMGENAEIWNRYIDLLDKKAHDPRFVDDMVNPPPSTVYWITSGDEMEVVKVLEGGKMLEYEGIFDKGNFYLLQEIQLEHDDKIPVLTLAQYLVDKSRLRGQRFDVSVYSEMVEEKDLYKAMIIRGNQDKADFHQEPPHREDEWDLLPVAQVIGRFEESK